MLTQSAEALLSKTISRGGLVVSLAVFTLLTNDPVNLPKLVLLAPIAGLSLGIWSYQLKHLFSNYRTLVILHTLFILALVINFFITTNPSDTTFFGTFGRNTGILTYFSLAVIAFGSSLLTHRYYYEKLIKALLLAGLINLIYCLFVAITGKDFLPWTNPTASILGTFGNTNFISAFFGIVFSVSLAIAASKEIHRKTRTILFISLPIYIYLIFYSKSIQGLMLVFLGTATVLFFFISKRFNKSIRNSYSAISLTSLLFLVLGILQIGPLSSLIYKPTVSIRGEYWAAGWKMFQSSPFYGLGLDSYANYYREFRRSSALVLPGVDTVTDAAHNVYIDLLYGGGLILFLPYLALLIVALRQSYEYWKNSKNYDYVFSALFVGFITYQAQALISINQIGLAVWGWILLGALIGYTRVKAPKVENVAEANYSTERLKSRITAGNLLTMLTTLAVAIASVVPVFITDNSWKYAIKNGTAKEIVDASNSWPTHVQRYALTAQIFNQVKLKEEVLMITRAGIKYDPRSFNLWEIIYNFSQNSAEREKAKSELAKLDPLNPKYKNI